MVRPIANEDEIIAFQCDIIARFLKNNPKNNHTQLGGAVAQGLFSEDPPRLSTLSITN